ncbi:ABC transporter ATP-binding protein [Zwartia sp.]|uniref:metal ABC transporter ATP-binding protein n=1 Tax=Zwartia sp. TaxID=2978004 RepID=UPI0027190CF5|nr:ABC transporter ATP-binding protein [Zwartia sp.]MDO9024498.1 ABC transporter ATP-binding protein [Zwartia sp.]
MAEHRAERKAEHKAEHMAAQRVEHEVDDESEPGMMAQSETAIEVRNLTLAYQGHPAVHHLSGAFQTGSLTAIVGPNGAGKSTFLSALSGQKSGIEGSIHFAGSTPGNLGLQPKLAYLPQQSAIDREFPVRVLDVVALGAWRELGSFRPVSAEIRRRASEVLSAVGLIGFERRYIGELSVGQLQRVLFARLLMQDAQIILLDEPFNALDTRTAEDLLGVVLNWHRQSRTVIAVLHDLEMVRQHFPQTLLLAREVIAWGPSTQVLSPENLRRARQTAEYWDDRAPWCVRPPESGGR